MQRNTKVNLEEAASKKEYLCEVTIIEARNLKTTNPSGFCNPFVKITVADKQPQITHQIQKSNSGAWNQSFTFENVKFLILNLKKSYI